MTDSRLLTDERLAEYQRYFGNHLSIATLLGHIEAQAEILARARKAARWELYDTGDGWRPCCPVCGDDAETCICGELDGVRAALGIVAPVDADGNIVDQEAFDAALSRAKETDGD